MAATSVPVKRSEKLRVARLRLTAQGLLANVPRGSEPAGTPAAVVARLGLMQAQDLTQACWALGVRVPGSTLADIHADLESGSIVRSWGARGTLMFMDPKLLRPLLSVTAPRMRGQAAAIWRREGITDAELEGLLPVVVERCGTAGASRAELMATMSDAGSDTTGQRGYHLLMALSLTGELVQGRMEPGSDTRQLFMASSRWSPGMAPEPAAVDSVRALEDLVLRYFRSHGPATVADCAWWLGLGLTPVRAALKSIGHQLATRVLGRQEYHLAPDVDALWDEAPGANSVLALPGFDEFLLGYKDRSATLDPEHADAIAPGGNGVFRRTLVFGGQTIGTWQLDAKGKERSAVAVPFDVLRASQLTRSAAAMEGYLRFREFPGHVK